MDFSASNSINIFGSYLQGKVSGYGSDAVRLSAFLWVNWTDEKWVAAAQTHRNQGLVGKFHAEALTV